MNLADQLQHPVFEIIAKVVAREGVETYVIGGFVRDLLLREGSPAKDIDIVAVGSGIGLAGKVKEALPGETSLTVFRNFGTAMLKWGETEIEFVGARKESYRKDSRKPVVEDGSLEDDLRRRDFTINAMAISLNPGTYGEVLDPFGGMKHLKEGMIRTPLDPDMTFSDDPLRMLRGIRFATRLGFRIEASTLKAIHHNRERISIVSQERITDELNKIMMTNQPSIGFRLLDDTGLLEIILPDLYRMKGVEEVEGQFHKDNFYHTLEVLDNISAKTDNLWLRWAALLHDVAKPRTKKFEPGIGWTFHGHEFLGSRMIPGLFRRLKLPLHDKMKYVQKLVLLHLRPIVLSQETVTDSAVRRLLFDAGEDLEDLMTLCEADITSKNERTVRRHLRNFEIVRQKLAEIEQKDHIRNFQPPISGDDIQRVFGIPPSRNVGEIKNAIKDAILDGVIPNEFGPAYRLMVKKGEELGLTVQNPMEKRGG
ncbi:MAG: CCA tRNA nucleotidyltransferase [Bacteroidales bacterium]